MFRTNCGRKLDPEDEFCPGCRMKVREGFPEFQAEGFSRKHKSSKAWVWAILSLFVICGLALGGYFLWGKGSERSSLYPVKVNGQWGYIDKTGKIVINPQFDSAWDFSEGLAWVKVGGKWGYIDKTGKIVINPQFDDAHDFHDGLALVVVEGLYGYIDRTGHYVWRPTI